MNDLALSAILVSSLIGMLVFMCTLCSLLDCHSRRSDLERARATFNAPSESPPPTSVQQVGDATDGCDETQTETETEANAPIYTTHWQDWSLILPPPPPPAMTREIGDSSLELPHQQSSSTTGSTLLPMYMDGSDK